MRWRSIPRAKADKRAEMRGALVRFGVWMKIELVAPARMCRMKVLSGVGGGVDVEKGRRIRVAWCGEGRRMVRIGGVSCVKDICLISEEDKSPFVALGCEKVVSTGNEGISAPPLPQNEAQKS